MKYLVSVIALLLFISCNSCCTLGSVPQPVICNDESKKQFVYDVMHDSYLWADETPILSEQNLSLIHI